MALDKGKESFSGLVVPANTPEVTPVSPIPLASSYEVGLGLAGTVRITTGPNGLADGCKFAVKVQAKGSATWEYYIGPLVSTKAANDYSTFSFSVPVEFDRAQLVFFGNGGYAVTASGEIARLNSF